MKKAILLAAYGAGNIRGLQGLQGFENFCRQRFPNMPVRWAYTSLLLRDRLTKMRQKSDSVRKALLRLHYENFAAVCVQPLQTICGREHEEVCSTVAEVSQECGLACSVGLPLLTVPEDAPALAAALLRHLPDQRLADEDVIFMGHGARHAAVSLYGDLAREIASLDKHVHIGTMSGTTCLEDILPRLNSHKIWLMPLLSVIGKHALADMAGTAPESWKSRIEAQGHICQPVLHGMAEYASVAQVWLNNLQAAALALPE